MKLWYNEPGTVMFDRTLPLGNGIIGAMVCPDRVDSRIVINHAWMWRRFKSAGLENAECAHWLPYIRKLYFEGKNYEAGTLATRVLGSQARSRTPFFDSDPANMERLGVDPRDGIYGPDPFVPVGEVRIHFDGETQREGFYSELELDTGEGSVILGEGDTTIHQQMIVSRDHDILLVKLSCKKGMSGHMSLGRVADSECVLEDRSEMDTPGQHGAGRETDEPEGSAAGQADTPGASGCLKMYGTLIEGRTFALHARWKAVGGSAAVSDGICSFQDVKELFLAVACATDHESEDVDSVCRELLSYAEGKSYEELRGEAAAAHGALFGRVNFELEGPDFSGVPTDKRVERFGAGEEDPQLLSLLLQMHRYFVIAYSKTGGVPGNLRGIWSDKTNPEWCCDIHNDINSQGMYFMVDALGLPEPADVLFDYLESLIPAGQDAARKIYGCRGIFIPLTTSCWPVCYKVEPGWDEMVTAAAWFSQHYWWRYDFYRDEKFLKDRCYPFLREAALFYLDYLVPDPRKDRPTYGKLQAVPSYSPENNYIGGCMPVGLTISCTYELELIRELFEHVKEAARILGQPEAEITEYQYVLDNLAPIGIDKEGVILEWDEDYPQEGETIINFNDCFGHGHRHLSPAIGVFPGDIITRRKEPELAEATYKLLHRRIHYGAGQGGWASWMAVLFSRIGTPEEALERLRVFVEGKERRGSGACVFNPSGGMCSCIAAAELEMVLQSHDGAIELLPNLPESWKSGHFEGVRARGGFAVDLVWKDGAPVSVRILSECGGECCVRHGEKEVRFETEKGGVYCLNGELAMQKSCP